MLAPVEDGRLSAMCLGSLGGVILPYPLMGGWPIGGGGGGPLLGAFMGGGADG
jgi:hypothetical protein